VYDDAAVAARCCSPAHHGKQATLVNNRPPGPSFLTTPEQPTSTHTLLVRLALPPHSALEGSAPAWAVRGGRLAHICFPATTSPHMASQPSATSLLPLLVLLVLYAADAFVPLSLSSSLPVRAKPASSTARWAKEPAATKKAAAAAAAAATAAMPAVAPSTPPSLHHEAPTRIQDLVRLLHESEDPLWELVKFEAETSAAQDEKAAGLIQQRVLDQGGIHSAARDFLATKLQSSNVPVRTLVGDRRKKYTLKKAGRGDIGVLGHHSLL